MYEVLRRSGAKLRLSKQRLGLVVPRVHHIFGSIFESDALHLAELGGLFTECSRPVSCII